MKRLNRFERTCYCDMQRCVFVRNFGSSTDMFLIMGTPAVRSKFAALAERHDKVSKELQSMIDSDEIIKLSKEQSELAPVKQLFTELLSLEAYREECKELEALGEDEESKQFAIAEREKAEHDIVEKEYQLIDLAVPDDDEDPKELILEVRAGTGGLEAQLFCEEIFSMYEKYCRNIAKLRFEIKNRAVSDIGGYREASALITGHGAFRVFRFESGVHRVQRKPLTDKTRIHTSTMTVAVLPTAPEIDFEVPESEIAFETTRSRGAGGQHVNTTDSAVKATHIPTGITVTIQDERSQHRNKAAALQILKARIYSKKKAERDRERSEQRNSMIGTGERNERIRTYNFPQDRVTDHRIQSTENGVADFMEGKGLDHFAELLSRQHLKEKLEHLVKNNKD